MENIIVNLININYYEEIIIFYFIFNIINHFHYS